MNEAFLGSCWTSQTVTIYWGMGLLGCSESIFLLLWSQDYGFMVNKDYGKPGEGGVGRDKAS